MSHRLILIVCFCLAAGLSLPRLARAAILYVDPQTVETVQGETFLVNLRLDSEGEVINVVELSLPYPSESLEVVSLIRGGSILSLWPEEPKADPETGAITLAGGVPNGRIASSAEIITVLFRAKARGQIKLQPDPVRSRIYLNDGLGTKTSLTTRSSAVQIGLPDSLAPQLSSPTHPDESRWSAQRTFRVSWLKRDSAFYSFQLSPDPSSEPDDIPESSEGLVDYPSLTDGIWYFTLKERLSGDAWSPVARRRVMVDGTPPEPFKIKLVTEAGRPSLVSFNAVDAASGIDRYEIRILKTRITWFPFFPAGQWQSVPAPLSLVPATAFSRLEIKAIDLAGNARIVSLTSSRLAIEQQRFALLIIGLGGLSLGLKLALRLLRRRSE